MKLKAKYKWNGEEVRLNLFTFLARWFAQNTTNIASAASIFCNKRKVSMYFHCKPKSFYSLSKYGIGCVIGYGCR